MTAIARELKLNAAFVKVADTLTADYDVIDLMHTLLAECVEILDVQGGGIMLVDGTGELQLVASTSERADFVEIMQLNAGVGPCLECFAQGVVVSVADIAASGERWPDFRVSAVERGYHSVHAVPMRLRGSILGTMNLFGTSTGALSTQDAAVAQALADVATIGILQERNTRETGLIADQLQRALGSRVLIEQAKGVLSASGHGSVEDAFDLMRHYARANNLPLRSVAQGIVTRTLTISEALLTD